jgi:hypothetical protein
MRFFKRDRMAQKSQNTGAIIGGCATVIAALIGGVFLLLAAERSNPTSEPTETTLNAQSAKQTITNTLEITQTVMPSPTVTPTIALAASGLPRRKWAGR